MYEASMLFFFKKVYYGPLFNYNMWPAAKSFTIEKFNWHMTRIQEKCPEAIAWLDENHPYIWTRSKFFDHCKVDYINNNLSESFNNWVKGVKDLQVVEAHDTIRQMIIAKFELRHKIAKSMKGKIIPAIVEGLTAQCKAIKDCEVLRCGHGTAEVSAPTKSGVMFRYAVNLELKTCSCRAWQVCGKPCRHALSFIAKISREVHMEDYVHEYFSVDKFKKAYAGVFNPMTSKQFWPHVDLGYKIKKPILRRKPGRSRKSRFKAADEPGSSKQKRCSEYHELGHTNKKCQGGLTAKQKEAACLLIMHQRRTLLLHMCAGGEVEVEVELRVHLLNHLMLVQVKLEKNHHLAGEEEGEEVFQGLQHTSMFRNEHVLGVLLYGLCCVCAYDLDV
ncbi:unnamed protein product [Urochloa humidicola]